MGRRVGSSMGGGSLKSTLAGAGAVLRSRWKWPISFLMLIVLTVAVRMLQSDRRQPAVFQAVYQQSKSSRQLESLQQPYVKGPDCAVGHCWQAGHDDGKLLHLARPHHAGAPVKGGETGLSATLTVIGDKRYAAVILIDPRDDKVRNKQLHRTAADHLERINVGASVVACTFTGGDKTKTKSKRTTYGRVVTSNARKILVVLCPLPQTVECCVNKQVSSLTGSLGASPVCVDLRITLEAPGDEGDKTPEIRPVTVFNYSVCQFAEFYERLGVALLVDTESLPYVSQWIAYHQWLGIKRAIIYLVNGTDPALVRESLMPYLLDGSVVVSAWGTPMLSSRDPNKSPWETSDPDGDNEVQDRITMALYTDCLYRYRHSSDLMLILDAHQYILWRNISRAQVADNSIPTVARSPLSIADLLPESVVQDSDAPALFSIKQAVFHPPLVVNDSKTQSNLDQLPLLGLKSGQRKPLPLDISSVMRCRVGEGVAKPRFAFTPSDLAMVWPGEGQAMNDMAVTPTDWTWLRINSYQNRSLECDANVMDTGMHTADDWNLLNDVIKTVIQKQLLLNYDL